MSGSWKYVARPMGGYRITDNAGRTLMAIHSAAGGLPSQRLSMVRIATAAPELLEALEMVRDADDDCRLDGLPTIPEPARAKIDAAISRARTGT